MSLVSVALVAEIVAAYRVAVCCICEFCWAVDRLRRVRVARVVGHVSWWVFVVARLMSDWGLATGGMPRRYADYGWSAYEPLTDRPPSGISEHFFNTNVIATVAVAALAATVIAAVVEAILCRRWLLGAGTVLAPVTGAAIILTALYERAGYLGGGQLHLPLLTVFMLVLLGVAVREVWSRGVVPRWFRPT